MDLFMIVFPIVVAVPVGIVMWWTRPGQPLPPKPLPPHAKVAVGIDPGKFNEAAETMVVAIKDVRSGMIAMGPTFEKASEAFRAFGRAFTKEYEGTAIDDRTKSPFEYNERQKGDSYE